MLVYQLFERANGVRGKVVRLIEKIDRTFDLSHIQNGYVDGGLAAQLIDSVMVAEYVGKCVRGIRDKGFVSLYDLLKPTIPVQWLGS